MRVGVGVGAPAVIRWAAQNKFLNAVIERFKHHIGGMLKAATIYFPWDGSHVKIYLRIHTYMDICVHMFIFTYLRTFIYFL